MSQILAVKFTDYGQVYHFSSGPFVVREGQQVLVKTDQGMGLGDVIQVLQAPPEGQGDEHKVIYRLANEEDLAQVAENNKMAREAFHHCRKCIDNHKLEMKLVDVEVYFDRSKMVFYFTAPGRIDFRELIKDLVKEFRTRIELRQIGVRHETQMLGAIGNCGQICCCRRFMRKFAPVTIKMAKEQNLFLNPAKISGICGRLLCCLAFEQEGYEEFHRQCPKVGKKFKTSLGHVKVIRTNFFKKTISLLTEDYEEKDVSVEDWPAVLSGEPLPVREEEELVPRTESLFESRPKPKRGVERKLRDTRKDAGEGDDQEVRNDRDGKPRRSGRGKKTGDRRSRGPRKDNRTRQRSEERPNAHDKPRADKTKPERQKGEGGKPDRQEKPKGDKQRSDRAKSGKPRADKPKGDGPKADRAHDDPGGENKKARRPRRRRRRPSKPKE